MYGRFKLDRPLHTGNNKYTTVPRREENRYQHTLLDQLFNEKNRDREESERNEWVSEREKTSPSFLALLKRSLSYVHTVSIWTSTHDLLPTLSHTCVSFRRRSFKIFLPKKGRNNLNVNPSSRGIINTVQFLLPFMSCQIGRVKIDRKTKCCFKDSQVSDKNKVV